jgi:hypothetical protein
VTATGAEAGNDLVPAGPVVPSAVRPDDVGRDDVAQNDVHPAAPVPRLEVRHRKTVIRAGLAGLVAVIVGYGSWLMLRRAVNTNDFPPYLSGTSVTPITRYSGPWLTAAAGAALVAALLLLFAAVDLIRWSRSAAGGNR